MQLRLQSASLLSKRALTIVRPSSFRMRTSTCCHAANNTQSQSNTQSHTNTHILETTAELGSRLAELGDMPASCEAFERAVCAEGAACTTYEMYSQVTINSNR